MPNTNTETDLSDGVIRCTDCDEFAYLARVEAMKRLPPGYSGEACGKCGLWMCRISKLEPKP